MRKKPQNIYDVKMDTFSCVFPAETDKKDEVVLSTSQLIMGVERQRFFRLLLIVALASYNVECASSVDDRPAFDDGSSVEEVRERKLPNVTLFEFPRTKGYTPMGLCQGDCDKDQHCQGNLICFKSRRSKVIPGCIGEPVRKVEYCVEPPKGEPQPLEYCGEEPPFKLGRCQGDCDRNKDCQPGLKCFKRRKGSTNKVPGCIGEGRPGVDYCWGDPPPLPTPSCPVETPAPTPSPTPMPSPVPTIIVNNTIAVSARIRKVLPAGQCNPFTFRLLNTSPNGLGPRTGPLCQTSGTAVLCEGPQEVSYAWEVEPDTLPTLIDSAVSPNPPVLVDPILAERLGHTCQLFFEVVFRVECGDAKLDVDVGSGCFVDIDGAVVCPAIALDCTRGCGPRVLSLEVEASNQKTTACTDNVFLTGMQ